MKNLVLTFVTALLAVLLLASQASADGNAGENRCGATQCSAQLCQRGRQCCADLEEYRKSKEALDELLRKQNANTPAELTNQINELRKRIKNLEDQLNECRKNKTDAPLPSSQPSATGQPGQSCWDLNWNGKADLASEDRNDDKKVDVQDCQGAPGKASGAGAPGQPGQSCWDLNGNGKADLASEDRNDDKTVDVQDCQGAQGASGKDGVSGAGYYYLSLLLGVGGELDWRGADPKANAGMGGNFHGIFGVTGNLTDRWGIAAFGTGGVFVSPATHGPVAELGAFLGPIVNFDSASQHRFTLGVGAAQWVRSEADSDGLDGNGLGWRVGPEVRYLVQPIGPLVLSSNFGVGFGRASGWDARDQPFDRFAVMPYLGLDIALGTGVIEK